MALPAMLFLAACSATDWLGVTHKMSVTDPETGAVTETRELSDETVAVVGGTLEAGASSGGLLGILSSAGLALWGIYQNRKASSAKKVAASIATGVSDVLNKIAEAEASGTDLKVTKEDALELLKAAQNNAGTRDAVRKLLAKQGLSESLVDKIIAAFC